MTSESHSWSRIDAVCDEFELAWQNGSAPVVPEWLDLVDAELRSALLSELIRIDLEYRMRAGQTELSLAEYVQSLGIDLSGISRMRSSFRKASRATDDAAFPSTIAQVLPSLTLAARGPSPALPDRFGNYEIIQVLGGGGMGIVYKARQLSPDRFVALKTLPLLKASDPQALARFEAEIAAIGRLNHPGIVTVFEAGNADGLPYFSMSLVDGKPLSTHLRNEPMSSRATGELALQLADALRYAHSEGIVHRDIKPGNVLIDGAGRPLLSDFGLAKCLESGDPLTESGLVLGTAAYMPPEQASGIAESATPAADIYSVGATIYHCLTGRPPFQAAKPVEVFRQVLESDPVSPRLVNPDVDIDLETICLKCLDKNPGRRFATAAELRAELQRYLNGEPILSRRLGFAGRCVRYGRRHPTTIAAFVLAVCLLVLVSAGIPLLFLMQAERDAAVVQADIQRYFSLDNEARRKSSEKPPGWTWEVLDLLRSAAELDVDGKDPVQIRSHIATALITPDVRLRKILPIDSQLGGLACTRDGRFVAMAEIRGRPICRVHVVEIVRQGDGDIAIAPWFTCDFDTTPASSNRPDGFRSVCLSPDGNRVAAGTRNGELLEWTRSDDGTAVLNCHISIGERKQGITQVSYSMNGERIYFLEGDDLRFCELHPTTRQVNTLYPARLHDFIVRPDGSVLLGDNYGLNFFDTTLIGKQLWDLLPNGLSKNRTMRLWDSSDSSILTAWVEDPEELHTDSPSASHNWIFDASTGFPGIPLPSIGLSNDGGTPPYGFDFAQSIVAGGIHSASDVPGAIREGGIGIGIWDALAGTPQCTYSFSQADNPLVTVLARSSLALTTGHSEARLLELRTASALADQSISAGNVAFRVVAPGGLPVSAFAISDTGNRLATMEYAVRTGRVRLIDCNTGKQILQWLLLGDHGSWRAPHFDTSGLAVNSDLSVSVAIDEPGTLFSLTSDGLAPIPGVASEFIPLAMTSESKRSHSYEAAPLADFNQNFALMRPYVTAKFLDCPHPQNEKLIVRIRSGPEEVEQEFRPYPAEVGADTWYVCDFSPLETENVQRHGVTVEITPQVSDLATVESRTKGPKIFIGQVGLVPVRPRTQADYFAGPVTRTPDGSVVGIDDEVRMLRWESLDAAPIFEWTDPINDHTSIRAIAAGGGRLLFGNRWGHVGLLEPDNTVRFVNRVSNVDQTAPTGEDIDCVAISGSEDRGVVTNRSGETILYSLERGQEREIGRFQIHAGRTTALALSSDGSLMASASAAGELKLSAWHEDLPNLLCEIQLPGNPAADMKFAPDDSRLFVRCDRERGVRIVEINALRQVFRQYGVDW
ncbi:MAG: serine/threonine-protein kinase [Planctomycetaceae bacterium]